uniref:Putative zinc finger, CCHC-type n=1 Tax=Tanacetum cinerariifolium TaxID=118510 RepID=A0A6L2NCN8_TANCI|nr:putative zinc finger, CCHC-type [Tanacetum cinerariifolium]
MAEPENVESTVQFDAKEYEEHQENPNQKTPTEFPKSDIKQYFTFDDVPPLKWRERSIKMLTWCTAELQYYTIDVVIKRFLTRLQGRLRDWYHKLGEYRQLQIQQSISPEAFMGIIYSKFIVSPWGHTSHTREEFLKMKCCSFQKKDLVKHYDRVSQRFYCINGVDDVNLKQVFLKSFPESLGNEEYWALEARNVTIAQTSLGESYKPVEVFDLESLYSLDDEPSNSVLCTIAYSNLSSDDDSNRDSLEGDSDFGVHMINPIPHVLPIQEDPPLPLAKIHLLADAYAKPILVIALFDTASLVSILNPNILPNQYWKPHHQNFMAAIGEKFVIDKISVPINIRLFPKYVIKRRLLGLSSYGKDLLIGFDILHKLPNLRWTSEGLHYRSFFNPWTAMHLLFVASISPPIFNINSIKQRLIQTYCASSRTEFLTKHPSPLWLIPSFFVSLPFKQNEDVNPTKASHPGMNPDHYQLAKEDCEQQVSQGIIEPTTSPWACEAFYVNKRSEQNISIWSKDHSDAYKWIKANGQWLFDNFDHCEVETSDDDDDARSSIDLHNSLHLMIHQAPVRSTSAPEFVRHENGLVEIKFSSSQYEAAKIDDDEDLPRNRKSSQKNTKEEPSQPPSPSQPPLPHKPPSPPPHKLSPYNQKALSILHQDSPTKDKEVILPPIFLITKDPSCSYSQEYEQEFPALTAFEHLDSCTKHDWKIKNPITIRPTGHANTISPVEATLNISWKLYRALEARYVIIAQTSLGELYQLILNALATLYNQKKFLAEFERTRKRLGTASDDKYLQIKCKDKSSCDCTQTKKKFHSKRFSSLSGHFARNCLDKKRSQALIQALNQVEPVDVSDLESLYSLDDEPSDPVLCTIAYSNLSSDDDSDTDSLEGDFDFGVHMINPIPHVLPIQEDPPFPLAKIYLLTDAYAKPISVIAFFGIGSSVSILNPNILLDHYWKPHHQTFMAANGENFVIDKISIPINIRLFPKCLIKRRLLGSSSHGKDLLISFDILHKLPNLRWTSEGLHYRSFFNPWTAMHRLFVVSITPPINNIKQRLIQPCCASSHTEFLTKHPLPLWLNLSFFVSLPFKQNEDVNPTKASHPGMNPDHYQLTKEECEQLVSQGIIEPTTSPWACEAFYVNKRSKQSHAELLSKFYSLVTKYEIMLSEKKMEDGVTTIQFNGMEIFDGKYQPQPHVAQELLKLPDELSSQKMIKQQTEAVKAIKSLAEKMPPLKIPASSEKRILQTDASDECWRAVQLVQDNNNKRHVCGYKSGMFKASEKPYHSMFKEILAVKQVQEKAAPSCTVFEVVKLVFTVKVHKENYPKDARRVQNHSSHFLSMVFLVASHKEEGSSSNTTPTVPVFDLPEEIVETIRDLTFEKRAKLCYKTFLTILLKNHGLCIKGLRLTHQAEGVKENSKLFIQTQEIEANGQWLYDNFNHCEVETSDDDEHFDPFEDDPTHLDARWSP